jgi:acetamidase/formamidase
MTAHHLPATADTVVDVFDRDTPPVLTVDPGDSVTVHSLDAHGYLEPMQAPGVPRPTVFAARRGHCLTGPIAVRGAEPGNALAVHLDSMRPDAWGWTKSGGKDTVLNRRLGVTDEPSTWFLWDIDVAAGTATNDLGHTVRLAPFLGMIGVAPEEPGEHDTVPPRAASGGNIDCRELVADSTLYLPVRVPGALLLLGDGHGAQGDGEVCGTAIECPMTTGLRLDVVEPQAPGVHAVTPAGRITFGFSEDLNVAMGDALDAMVIWMQSIYRLDRPAALALASVVVDLRITQVVNNTWGVHAVLPHDAVQ